MQKGLGVEEVECGGGGSNLITGLGDFKNWKGGGKAGDAGSVRGLILGRGEAFYTF